MIFAVVISCMALIAGVFGVGLGARAIDEAGSGSGAGGGAPATATIHLTEFTLDPSSVTLAAGGTLAVHNDGAVSHNLAIEGTDLITPMLDGGGTANLKLTGLAPGTYNIICQVAGHSAAGMKGTLVVTSGDAAAATEAGDHSGAVGAGARRRDPQFRTRRRAARSPGLSLGCPHHGRQLTARAMLAATVAGRQRSSAVVTGSHA